MMNRHSHQGFTLLETLIYITLFSILMTGAMIAAYNLLEGGGRNKAAIGTQEEGTFINRKINWALTGASAVSVLGGGTKLSISRPDLGAQSPLVLEADGSTITLSRGGSVAVQLNSERYPVENPASGPVFNVVPGTGGKPPSVTVSFQIKGRPFIFRTYVRE